MTNETSSRISPVDEVQILRAAACDWRLSRGDIAVVAVLLDHCDDDRHAFPGPDRISKFARLEKANVKVSLRKLEQMRYIEVARPGKRKANHYRFLDPPNVPRRKVMKMLEQTKRMLREAA